MQTDPVLSRRVIHKGRKFDFEQVTIASAKGGTITREVVRHPGAVVIVPVLDDGPRGGRVVMIRNRRFAIGETLLEFPAGTIDPGEKPEVCAGRELIEETGYQAAKLLGLGWFYTTPGMTDERMHVFVATGLKPVGQNLEEDENITVELVSVADAAAAMDSGSLRDGKSMVALTLAIRRGHLTEAGRYKGA